MTAVDGIGTSFTAMGLALIHVLVVLFVMYVAWALILYVMQPRLLYYPVRKVSYTPSELGLDFQDVVLRTDDALALAAWYLPAENARFTVLFCHGNAGNMAHHLDTADVFNSLQLNCLMFDYRGYGRSAGRPAEQGTYLDAAAAYRWLTQEKKISPDDIIIFGRSLGGCIAAHLAAEVRAGALVVESCFTSYVDIAAKFYPYMPVRWFARFAYSTIDCIKNVRCPVMLVHSRNDEVVPFEFGRRLYKAANEPKEFVEIFGSHNDAFLVSAEIYRAAWTGWLSFLQDCKDQSAS